MKVAIIPARGGSKRIPRKNIKLFHGKPLIAYSIEAAIASNCFDKIIVSTDDEEIASVAKQYGAEVPFVRPNKIADDYATTMDVIRHAICWLTDRSIKVEYVCCIYATAPFLTAKILQKGYKQLVKGDFNYAFGATSYAFPIQRALKLNKSGSVEMFMPEHLNTRSQDLEEAYHDAGQFYWGKAAAFLDENAIFSAQSSAVLLPRISVQDIDTIEDWTNAEVMFKMLNRVN
ncbi:MAG: pseudaminic acid cytidylyltransferase [Kangiellaceae bacterium]